MSKTIRVSDEVYHDLGVVQRKHETLGETVGRLITIYSGIVGLSGIVGGIKSFGEWQDAQAIKKEDLKL